MFYKSAAYFLIILGAAWWTLSIFYLEGNTTHQLMSIAIVTLGIFLGHLWEELYKDKEKK